jgi:glycosyltransferase involved in cell wall biosynthesis
MRVLFVTSSYPKFPGDVTAPFIESTARALAARGHEIDVVLPHHPDLRRPRDEPVRFFPYRYAPCAAWNVWGYAASLEADVRVRGRVLLLAPLVALALRRRTAALLESGRYDVAHAHWVIPNAALVADLVRAHGVPLVISLHGSDVFMAERRGVLGALARAAFRRAGAVTACSGDLRRRALGLGAPPERTRTVPYGVDPALFAPRPPEAGVRERLGARLGQTLVLAVGRLVEKKGFRHLLEAAARVPEVHVAVVGDGDLRGELAALAATLGASVSFLGALERHALAAAYAAADIVAVPSVVDRAGNVDGLPNVLLEALAAGRAVVASRVAGIPDVVEDGVNARLVAPGDASALAEALRSLAGSAEARAALGREARFRAERELSWDTAARSFEECYVQAAALDAR